MTFFGSSYVIYCSIGNRHIVCNLDIDSHPQERYKSKVRKENSERNAAL